MSDPLIEKSIEHAHANHDAYMEGFLDFLRIPSISTDPAYAEDIQRAADWVVDGLKRLGFDKCGAMPTGGHPLVYGEWLNAGEDKPTVLIYAHYDVQPVDPLDLWESPPFEPEVRDGKLYARGVADDKIGVYGNLKVFESILAATGTLPINVKVFFEGEEETGSPSMETFIEANKELLAADLLVICDGGSPAGMPSINYSLRGIIGAEVTVTGPENDVHSGLAGGAVHNPIHMVSQIIASCHDDDGHILIPGFYEGVIPLTDEERAYFDAKEEDIINAHKQIMGDFRLWGESNLNYIERTTARPTLDVNGIYGGYQGDGMKTIIPSRAGFKVTMRLAPGQDPDVIAKHFTEHVKRFACDTVDIDVTVADECWPMLQSHDSPVIDAKKQAFEAVWGITPTLVRGGGSIPILGMFQRALEMPMTGWGLGTGGLVHAPNEFLNADYFQINIDSTIHFYHYLVEALSE